MRRELKTIPRFPNYAITKDGRVWSKPRKDKMGRNLKGQWLKPGHSSGYLYVNLRRDFKTHLNRVHRLVLETFVGPCPEGMECRHLNSKSLDNRLENLCWDTHKNNLADRKLAENPQLTEQDICMMKQMYQSGLYTLRKIAKIYKIKAPTLAYWLRGERKRHLTGKLNRRIEQNKQKKIYLSCLRGEKLPGSKLTGNKVRAIRYLRDMAGFTLKNLAWQFDTSITNIHSVCLRQTWKHI